MKTYKNPIKKHGDFADPFVLRFNGNYYLYCTNPGVRCWQSQDLINWTFAGNTVPEEEFPGLVPFAPEVVYDNGSFYMYTSPHGLGHYVLKSNSPLGPFRKISENISHAIDLSIFIDDDGMWYAYWADDRGILGCNMPSPTEFGEPIYIGAYLNGWTEGPFVIKKDGFYHLTYTGNHFLSKGYRINGAYSRSPLGPFIDYDHNPLVLSAEGKIVGLGHSSTVIGPNLFENWMFYHNLNSDRTRDLNLDKLIIGKDDSFLLGPTSIEIVAPAKPDYYDPFDTQSDETWILEQGNWKVKTSKRVSNGSCFALCSHILPKEGKAELHIASCPESKGSYGIIFSGKTTKMLKIDKNTNLITFCTTEGDILWTMFLPQSFCHTALHSFLFSWGDSSSSHLDRIIMRGLNIELEEDTRIGYFSDDSAVFGSVTISTEKKETQIPVGAIVPALPIFTINIPESSLYLCTIYGKTPKTPSLFRNDIRIETLNRTENVTIFSLMLVAGFNVMRLEGAERTRIRFDRIKGQEEKLNLSLKEFDKKNGNVVFSEAEIHAHFHPFLCRDGWEAGVLFRVTNLSDGGEGLDKELGTNFFTGYRVAVRNKELCLFKHAYDEKLLISCPFEVKIEYDITISCVVDTITVFSETTKLFSYTDGFPIMVGRAGLHSRKCNLEGSLEISSKNRKSGGSINE